MWGYLEGYEVLGYMGSVDVWKCYSPQPSHYVNCKRFHKITPHYQNIMKIQNFLTILKVT